MLRPDTLLLPINRYARRKQLERLLEIMDGKGPQENSEDVVSPNLCINLNWNGWSDTVDCLGSI